MTEEWKDVPGYEGLHRVSNYGRFSDWVNGEWLIHPVGHNNCFVFSHNHKRVSLSAKKIFATVWGFPCPVEGVECCDYHSCHSCGFNPEEAERRKKLINVNGLAFNHNTGLWNFKLVREDA